MQFACFDEEGPGGTEEQPELQGREGELAHQGLGAIADCLIFGAIASGVSILCFGHRLEQFDGCEDSCRV